MAEHAVLEAHATAEQIQISTSVVSKHPDKGTDELIL